MAASRLGRRPRPGGIAAGRPSRQHVVSIEAGANDVYIAYTYEEKGASAVARVQLLIPDDERERFADQARREGITFSAWLRAAARARLEDGRRNRRFASQEDVEAFFRACDSAEGPETEPDWHEHLDVIAASRAGGESGT